MKEGKPPEGREVQLETDNGAGMPFHLYRACEAVGQVMELWGFKRIHGMIWMYVFLQPEPVSAQDIRQALGISSGLVSMTLAELQHWDVIHRQTVPGDRKDYFRAEFNIWKPILKVMREREYYQICAVLDALREVRAELRPEQDPKLAHAAQQLDLLIQMGDIGRNLFSQFIDVGQFMLRRMPKATLPAEASQALAGLRNSLSKLTGKEA